ncbi:MAG TPA: biotin/lipoyl-binding protein, partial [Gemmata sp.]|nr:biotin/lipoyl-binding protein [Gemmata sp.]
MTSTRFRPMGLALASIAVLCGCTKPDPNRVQGYVEGEFVYVASPYAGALEKLSVYRGTRVHAGDALFTLDCQPEKSARDEAERRVIQARSNLEDLKKGRRPTEIESLVAQLGQARAALVRSEKE